MSYAIRPVESEVLSVSHYASQLGAALRHVGGAELEGEVQRVQRRANGMVWFSLTDGEASLSAKVFARDAARLEHMPQDGDLVRVRVDRPDFYAAQGSLSLIVSAISLAGEGELLRRRAALVAQLEREGLCDPNRRRPLPAFPRAVGVIAGANSDGMSDVIRALVDRWPAVDIVTCACVVQGKGAPAQLIDALARLQAHPRVDVIVMARGGGSVQDLACFDDERLCRALFACELPVVCAIGHTDNVPVCNRVSWSAFTPSRSAEMVVPSARELRESIAHAGRLLDGLPGAVTGTRRHVEAVAAQLELAASRRLTGRRETIAVAAAGLERSAERIRARRREWARDSDRLLSEARAGLERRRTRVREELAREGDLLLERTRRRLDDAERGLVHHADVIAARDFRSRGWLLASAGGAPVRSAADLAPGSAIELHLHDGRASAVIDHIHDSEDRHDRNRS